MTKPQPALDLSTWLTKPEAAGILGVSTKSIEKFAATGKLQSAKRPQTGRPDAAVYHPADVERLRQERQAELAPFAVARIPENASPIGSPTSQTALERVAVTLSELRLQFQKPAETRLFLSIKEASRLTGLTQTYIRGLLDSGKLEGVKDGRRLRIRRRDLEGL